MDYLGVLILGLVGVFTLWFFRRRRKRDQLRVCVEGFVDPRFENVAKAFRKNFESGAETGAAFAVYYKGELVVDLWGGYVNQRGRIPWRENTMTTAFSCSKGINAILLAKFVEMGYLDYKKLVSHYWPEFAQNGKEGITVEMLISHQAGLIGFDKPISMRLMNTDYEKYLSLLETQKPFWEPGTQFGYHIFSWGCYVDALLRKVDPKKRTLDRIFHEEIAKPFGIDFFQGTPRSEQYRIVPELYFQPLWYQLHCFLDAECRTRLWYSITDPKGYNKRAKRACKDFMVKNAFSNITDYEIREIPLSAFNGQGTARGIAKLFGIISNGGVYEDKTLLSETTIRTLDQALVQGNDVVMDTPLKIGRGLMVNDSPIGSTMFGHAGFGGQMGAGDLSHKVGLSYLTNNLAFLPFIDKRFLAVRNAFYESLTQLQKHRPSEPSVELLTST